MKRSASFVVALAGLVGGGAYAQDGDKPVAPPAAPAEPAKPEKHENKISDAAKEVFERFDKIMYAPAKAGVKTLSGTVKMDMDLPPEMESMRAHMGAMELSFKVDFAAPDKVTVSAKEAAGGGGMGGMMDQMKSGMTRTVESVARFMLGVYRPGDDSEFDADVKEVDGRKILVLTSYTKNVEVTTVEFTLAAEGFPEVGVVTSKEKAAPEAPPDQRRGGRPERGARGGGDVGKVTMRFTYGKEGDRYRLDKMTMDAAGMPATAQQTLTYLDAGGVKIAHKWTMNMGEMQKFSFKFTELTVNEKAVELPK